ncbi:hypothetical protein ACT4UT_28885, partial [Bacillus sp. B-TM1]
IFLLLFYMILKICKGGNGVDVFLNIAEEKIRKAIFKNTSTPFPPLHIFTIILHDIFSACYAIRN